MTIGTLIIMLVGFSAGLICAILLSWHNIEEFRAERDAWRREAMRLSKELGGRK
jgi:hypothetical protein